MNMIQSELNLCFSEHCIAIDKIKGQEDNDKTLFNLEMSMYDLFLLICQFKDLIDIHQNRFKSMSEMFKPEALFERISHQVKNQPDFQNLSINFVTNKRTFPN